MNLIKHGLVLSSWVFCAVTYGLFYSLIGPGAGFLILLPVAVTAWFWNGWLGVLMGAGILGLGTVVDAGPVPLLDLSVFGMGWLTQAGVIALCALNFGYMSRLKGQIRVQDKTIHYAQYDNLTGLLNRVAFEEKLADAIAESRADGTLLAVLFVDLDRFKFVNDTYGHDAGDELLKEVAKHLKSHVRGNDLVGRLGGDEFVLALRGLKEAESAAAVARKLVGALNTPFTINDKLISIGSSIGISICPDDGEDVETLMKSADNAMYRVKSAGKNAYHFSSIEIKDQESRRQLLERHLRLALENGELDVRYQPQFDLSSRTLVGFEALLRWESSQLGSVSPEEFIPLAEEMGLIIPIGHWLLREVCHQNRIWQRAGYQPVKVSVNVSALQFAQPDFSELVARALHDQDLNPIWLELEVTESLFMNEREVAIRTLQRLARLGVQASLDDFGTGYSSLAYLQQLPISSLKIDRSFVGNLRTSSYEASSAAAIIEAICAMTHKLGKKVVAEGVETEAQQDFLTKLGCDVAQGFLYAKPLTSKEAEGLLERIRQNLSADTETTNALLLHS